MKRLAILETATVKTTTNSYVRNADDFQGLPYAALVISSVLIVIFLLFKFWVYPGQNPFWRCSE